MKGKIAHAATSRATNPVLLLVAVMGAIFTFTLGKAKDEPFATYFRVSTVDVVFARLVCEVGFLEGPGLNTRLVHVVWVFPSSPRPLP